MSLIDLIRENIKERTGKEVDPKLVEDVLDILEEVERITESLEG